jgi:hypothetical protein
MNGNESPAQLAQIDNGSKDENLQNIFPDDIGLWPDLATDEMREYWTKLGSASVRKPPAQLRGDGIKASMKDGRGCTTQMFHRKCANGEQIERRWLCYSEATGRLYCFECKLFACGNNAFSLSGFNDWRNAGERISSHEISQGHIRAVMDVAKRRNLTCRIDKALQKELEEQTDYWMNVLRRLISVITFLAERGLAFRGEDEDVGSVHNGNYLGLLELISQYDVFLKQHLQTHANKGSGHVNYLSSTICEELIQIMGDKVLNEVIQRVKKSKYYSTSVDSSEDNAHTDQLTVVLRYIEGTEPVERFLTFLEAPGHTGKEMADGLSSFLCSNGLSISDCRGQSYDNASNMSGRYQGMQAWIIVLNKLATYVPCFGHSLNLVGKEAASACSGAVSFFDFVQALYVFFTGSTARYKKLKEKLAARGLPFSMPKALSETRWSCRADACSALVKSYEDIKSLLMEMSEDNEEKPICRSTARGLHAQMDRLETGIFAEFWNIILERFNRSSQTLQATNLNLNSAVGVLQSILEFVHLQRSRFDDFEEAGKLLSGTNEYAAQRSRIRRPNVRQQPLDCGHTEEVELTAREGFRTSAFLPCVDALLVCLRHRLDAYKDVTDRFGFLQDFPSMDPDRVTAAAKKLSQFYSTDLDDNFSNELIQFQAFLNIFLNEKTAESSLEQFMYKLIIDKDVKATFPNTEVALKIFLTMMVTNCTGERSFSKMKLIKNKLRTTMGQARLCHLTLMSMESDILKSLDFEDTIHSFASRNARKVSFN